MREAVKKIKHSATMGGRNQDPLVSEGNVAQKELTVDGDTRNRETVRRGQEIGEILTICLARR